MRKFLLILAVLSLLAACIMGYGSRSSAPYPPAFGNATPSSYNYDPAMRDWYAFPYWTERGP